MDSAVKYYLYISDTKLDMLYEQIPQNLLVKIVSKLGLDIRLDFGIASVGVATKSDQSEKTRHSKLMVVTKYVEEHLPVGTLEAPQAYLKGTLSMYWCKRSISGNSSDDPSMALFVGSTDRVFLALVGSGQHIIGSQKIPLYPTLSATANFDNIFGAIIEGYLADEGELPPQNLNPYLRVWREKYETEPGEHLLREIIKVQSIAQDQRRQWSRQRFEFLAKTMYKGSEEDEGGKRVLVVTGTPIYVALAD